MSFLRRRRPRRARVMVLLNSLAPYGAETFALSHARFCNRARFDVTVCYVGGVDTLGDRFRDAGIGVFCLGERRRLSPLAPARLGRLLLAERVDVLQTHIGYAGVLGRLVGRAVGVPAVVSTEQTVYPDYPPLTRRAIDATFALAHGHVFISRAVHESFARVFPALRDTPPTLITNGIDARAVAATAAASRSAVRQELGLTDEQFVFGNVGRLLGKKGQRFAVRALARVRRAVPDACLVIVGGGQLASELRALAAAEGVADAIMLLGERLDVHRLLGAFDAYVHPATTEGLGIAVLEAMAAKLPVVASAVHGIPEFVHHGETGWLAKAGDVDGLATHMLCIAQDRAAAAVVAARGHALVSAEHDIRASVAAYERLYDHLLGRDIV